MMPQRTSTAELATADRGETMRTFVGLAALLAAFATLSNLHASAQEWPAKPVRIVVPFPAGGSTDRMARLVSEHLSKALKQQFYVENRPGAGGTIAASLVARTEADGYTLMAGGYGPHVMGPATGAKIDYDPIKDFTHVVMMGGESYVFAANSALGVKSLAHVVRLVNGRKEPLNFGSPGTNTLGQLMIDQFHMRIGTNKFNHVPYRGGAPLQTAILGNHVPLAALPIAPILPHIAAGTVVPLVVSSTERVPALKNVPTFGELGYSEIGGSIWFWIAGPKNLPVPVVTKLNHDVRRYLATAPVKQMFERDALLSMNADPAALTSFIDTEIKRWTVIFAKHGQKKPK
jgi:tripartite-type tricarboxylate transporter receptor subunit TctC